MSSDDHASCLWLHFLEPRRERVAWAKVSKVLHLMRPGLYPILDDRLQDFYRHAAREASSRLRHRRPELDHPRLYWAAIREDLVASDDGLREVRRILEQDDSEWISSTVACLSDLQLLDMLAWRAA